MLFFSLEIFRSFEQMHTYSCKVHVMLKVFGKNKLKKEKLSDNNEIHNHLANK